MPQYEIEINVIASRLDDPEPETQDEADMLAKVAKTMKQMNSAVKSITPQTHQELISEGLRLRKMITIRAESFSALAEALGKFDALAENMDLENAAVHGT
jgi:hypothetical protein